MATFQSFNFDDADHTFFNDSKNIIWIKASPIAKKLGFSRPEVAVVNNVDPDLRAKISTGVGAASWFVNEPGFYQLCFASKTPDAKRLQRWVFEDVLPSIRKNGGYVSPDATQEQLEALQTKIKLMRRKFAGLWETRRDNTKSGYWLVADACKTKDEEMICMDLINTMLFGKTSAQMREELGINYWLRNKMGGQALESIDLVQRFAKILMEEQALTPVEALNQIRLLFSGTQDYRKLPIAS